MSEDKPRLLIVDDEAQDRNIMRDAFAFWDYPLLVAADGDKALQLAEEYPIDMALLDVRMPGLSGMELAERLHWLDPNILIIMISAYTSAQDAVKATRYGAICYLPKPCPLSLMRDLVDDVWAAYLRGCQEQIGKVWVD